MNCGNISRLCCVFAAFAAFALQGCAPSKAYRDWDNAVVEDNIPAYEKLIRTFPDDKKYVAKAKERIEDIEWEDIRKYDTAMSYAGYLKKYPAGRYTTDAKKLACQRAAEISNIQLAYNFLEQNSSCQNVSDLRGNIEKWEFELAKTEKSPEQAYFFLLKYPRSPRAGEASETLDDKLYAKAATYSGKTPLMAYLELFPSGKHSAEAKGSVNAQAAENTAAAGDVADLVRRVLKDDDLSRKMACAQALSAKLNAAGITPEEEDKVRNQFYGLARGANTCDGFNGVLPAKPDSAALNTALAGFTGLIDERQRLGSVYTVIKQRNSILSDSTKVGEKLRDDLETDELTSAILGVEALGGLNLEIPEKGSVAAKEALAEFKRLRAQADANMADADLLFRKLDDKYQAASFYIAWSFAKLPLRGQK